MLRDFLQVAFLIRFPDRNIIWPPLIDITLLRLLRRSSAELFTRLLQQLPALALFIKFLKTLG